MAVQAPPRGSYRRRGEKSASPSAAAAASPQAAINEGAAIRRLIRRYILHGCLPTTSPYAGLTVAQYNAIARREVAVPLKQNWSSTGRAA